MANITTHERASFKNLFLSLVLQKHILIALKTLI